jgi:hypothetical protein
MYPIIFSSLSHNIARPIVDWPLDSLEQPTWTIYGKLSYGDFWFNCAMSNPSIIPGSYNVITDCLLMYFNNDFKWIDVDLGDESSTNFVHREEMVAIVNTVVV